MNEPVVRKNCGAVEFVKSLNVANSISEAVMFTTRLDKCVDPKWDEILETLESFCSLKDDGDGNDSIAPVSDTIDCAIHVALQLRSCEHPAPDRVIAGTNGTISFESGPKPMSKIEVVSGIRAKHYEDRRLVVTCTIGP